MGKHIPERAGEMHGVEGRYMPGYINDDGRITNQKFVAKKYREDGVPIITVEVRFDDQCKNGHETFSITGHTPDGMGGCIHDLIAEHFPTLRRLIPYHLCSTDGPMHYLTNAVFLAGIRDCWGLRFGEFSPINTKDGGHIWQLVMMPHPTFPEGTLHSLGRTVTGPVDTLPEPPRLAWKRYGRIGEGKERELDSARSIAIWPEATDEELSAPPIVLKARLKGRLPALLERFEYEMRIAGFTWPEEVTP